MKVERRQIFWMVAAGAHLVLVVFGAFSLTLWKWGDWARPLSHYSAASGADTGYGFFAPGISGQIRAVFDIVDKHGKMTRVPLESPSSHEAALRMGNIVDQFWEDADDSDDEDDEFGNVHRDLVASLAGKVLARHPEARQVKVTLEKLVPISMDEFRDGTRAEWNEFYSARLAVRARSRTTKVVPVPTVKVTRVRS